jgi:uncharacterized protein YegL
MSRPGGEIAKRPLHFFWIADCSGSMSLDGKIQSLNHAIRECIPHMQREAEDNPNAEVLIRAITFSTGARWHIETATPVADFEWSDLEAGGVTDMGKAFDLVTEQLHIPPMSDRALPPVLVLISDGQPTDDYSLNLEHLLSLPWAQKAVRIAIAIGHDADSGVLKQFIGNREMEPLQANNAEDLIHQIRWASTAVLKSASSPISSHDGMSSTPVLQPPEVIIDADAVW